MPQDRTPFLGSRSFRNELGIRFGNGKRPMNNQRLLGWRERALWPVRIPAIVGARIHCASRRSRRRYRSMQAERDTALEALTAGSTEPPVARKAKAVHST